MRPLHLLVAVVAVPVVDAYVASSSSSRTAFMGRPALAPQAAPSKPATAASMMSMDVEGDSLSASARYSLEKTLKLSIDLETAEAKLNMPWKSSIDPRVEDDELLYMPFWEWQMDFMKENLTNLRVASCSDGKTDFSYKENKEKKARIVNLCASSAEYRKIRMTYYDAGDNTQVFNSVWYPDPKYNLPVLGIDLLAFNRKKYLAIVDFQPLHEDENDHAATYEHILKPIKEKYDSLKGRMSSKFYDETQFFSQEMLFARFDDEDIVLNDLQPAFQEYVKTHLELVRNTEAEPAKIPEVLERQQAYDTYSAERDPATGLFAAMFGGEWAGDFVHNFLFSLSERPAEGSAIAGAQGGNPFAGGPPASRKQGGGGNPFAGGPPAAPQKQASREEARETVGVRR